MGDDKRSHEELLLEIQALREQINEKKDLEIELAKTKILMQAAFDQSPVPLVVVTYPDFTFKIVNKATEDYLLVNAANYLNKAPTEVDWNWHEYYPDGTPVANIEDLPMPQAMQGIVTKNQELYIVRHDGSIVWELASASPIYDAEKQLIGAILAITDITERKKTEMILSENERKLKEQNEEYESINEELRETNEQLQIAKLKAEESDRLKTAFLQNMSHEIRTPMNAIMGFSSLLVENIRNKEKIEQFSEIIRLRCEDLLNIIDDILDISKIESGQLDVNIEDCRVSSLFEELFILFNEFKEKNNKQDIKLKFEESEDSLNLQIKTDQVKLKQILINLLNNAFKFTFEGSILCGYKIENTNLVFYVKDTGIGIPDDKFVSIFERFVQLKQLPQKNISGTGLGLSIVEGLVNLLKGKVWLESELGKGSTFYFSIPFNKSDATNTPVNQKTIETAEDFSKISILIVEDDYYNSLYLKEILSHYNFKIQLAETGLEAVKIVSDQHFDLILMDLRLPDIPGYEATKRILAVERHTKVVAQTAFADIDERDKAIKAGCIDYLRKPTKKEDLIMTLKKHLLTNK